MKKIALLVLVLFGMGLASQNFAASSDDKTPTAPGCPGNIMNRAPCDLKVCLTYVDCTGITLTTCVPVPAGGVVNINAITGGCCSSIVGITIQLLGPPSPISPMVPPGGNAVYVSGVAGPCFKLVMDYSTFLPDFVVHP